MEISRVWCMPSKWTFTMPPVKELLDKYNVGIGWIDPFSGENSTAEYTNDIEGRNAVFTMDGLEFLKMLPDNQFAGCLFDPPYSTIQCLRKYTPKHGGTAGMTEYWAKCKDEIMRLVRPGGTCISFGWDSIGMGIKRNFDIVEIMLICHGACHKDTIITIDKKRWGKEGKE